MPLQPRAPAGAAGPLNLPQLGGAASVGLGVVIVWNKTTEIGFTDVEMGAVAAAIGTAIKFAIDAVRAWLAGRAAASLSQRPEPEREENP